VGINFSAGWYECYNVSEENGEMGVEWVGPLGGANREIEDWCGEKGQWAAC